MFTPDSYPPPPPPPPRFRRPPSPPPVPSPPPPWLIDPCNKQGTFSFLLRCTPSPPPHAPQPPSAPPPGAPPPSPSPPPPPSPPFIAPPPAEPPTKPPLAFPPQPPFIRVSRAATPKAVAETINGDYREATKGLLVHQFDETEDKQRPWRGCPNGIARPGAGDECARFGSTLRPHPLAQDCGRGRRPLLLGTKSGIILSQGAWSYAAAMVATVGREARLMAARASIGAQRGGLRRAMYGAAESRTDRPTCQRSSPSVYRRLISRNHSRRTEPRGPPTGHRSGLLLP